MTVIIRETSLEKEVMKKLDLFKKIIKPRTKECLVVTGGSIALSLIGGFLERQGYKVGESLKLVPLVGLPFCLSTTLVYFLYEVSGYHEAVYEAYFKNFYERYVKSLIGEVRDVEWYEMIFKDGDYIPKEELYEELYEKLGLEGAVGTYRSPWYQKILSVFGKGKAKVTFYPKGDINRKDLEEILSKKTSDLVWVVG